MARRETSVGDETRKSARPYDDMLRMANRDALLTLVALACVIVVWLACGFGLAGIDMYVWHTPLWVVAGLLGTWIAAIIAAVFLARRFQSFDLEFDDEDADDSRGAQ